MTYGSTDPVGSERFQWALAARLKALKELEAEIVSFVRSAVARALRAGDGVSAEGVVQRMMASALVAADDAGAGLLIGAKNTAKGLILGIQDTGGDATAAALTCARASAAASQATGADARDVMDSVVDGVAEAMVESGASPNEFLSEAARLRVAHGRKAEPGALHASG